MYLPNTDLLPPLFDEVVVHYGDSSTAGPGIRSDIVKALENGIINAAADAVRSARKLPGWTKSDEKYVELKTFDRLSGAHLSRAALIEQLQETAPIPRSLLETALLLVEAQIDLRLQSGIDFELSGIKFTRQAPQEKLSAREDIASWCRDVLQSTLQGAANDSPSLWPRLGRRRRPEGLRILVEGLQLSATLRVAVPYEIRVEHRLVDPLLEDPNKDNKIRLLHVSDLHLVADITEPGRRLARPFLAQTHSFTTAQQLGRTVSALKPPFDVLLATGDLTTDGERGSFETLLQYLQGGSLTGENQMRIRNFGLTAGKGKRLLVPGNHDRYMGAKLPIQHVSYLFEDVLGTPRKYPYVVGHRSPAKETDSQSLTLLFFVFDSSLPEGRESADPTGYAAAAAQGHLGVEEIDDFISQAKHVAANKKVKGLSGTELDFDPRNTVRIAVLHHHPVATRKADEERARREQQNLKWKFLHPIDFLAGWKKDIDSKLTRMNGADRFLRSCFEAGIQLVLFGHEHRPYQRMIVLEGSPDSESPFGATKSIYAFCCPTTLQHSRHGNGFYVFDFIDKTNITIDSYISNWDNKSNSMPFIRDAKHSRGVDLANFADSDLESAYIVKP